MDEDVHLLHCLVSLEQDKRHLVDRYCTGGFETAGFKFIFKCIIEPGGESRLNLLLY